MAVVITLAGTDRTNYCDLKSIYITDTLVSNADTMEMGVSVPTSEGWRPEAGNEVIVANGTSREFAGLIEDLYEEQINPSHLRYRLTCRDYTFLFDKYLVVDESTESLSADTWVSRIINSFTTGFTDTNVSTGPALAPQRFDYIAPSEAIRSIADKSGYGWYIDYNKDVHFFAANSQLAPTTSFNLEATTPSTMWGGFKFRETVSGAKTRVYVKDYKRGSSVQWNRQFTGDGNTRFFLLGNEPVSIDATTFTATLNGVAIDALTDFVDGNPGESVGSSSQLFICFDNQGVRCSSGVSAYTSTQTLSVTFNYLVDAVTTVNDAAAQTEMASREGGDGVHEYVIADASLTSADGSDDLATLAGNVALDRYAFPRVTGSFLSFSSGWRAGQVFDIASTRRLGGDATNTYHVQQVTKSFVNAEPGADPLIKNVIEFADGVIGI